MKKHLIFPLLALLLLAFASCSDDDQAAPLLNPQEEMCGHRIYSGHVALTWNDEQHENASVEFFPVEGDTTRLQMKLYDVIPVGDVNFVLDVTPETDRVLFAGACTNVYYDLTVQGSYAPGAEGETGMVDLQCSFRVTGGVPLEREVVIPFGAEHYVIEGQVGAGTVEWEGKSYSRFDFVRNAIGRIFERMAQQTSAMRFVFHEDATLDIALQHAGDTEFTPWITARYWRNETVNDMYIELTPEDKADIVDRWIGTPDSYSDAFIPSVDHSYYLLKLISWYNGRWTFTVASPYLDLMVSNYARGKAPKELEGKELEEVQLLREILSDNSAWGNWRLMMTEGMEAF